jgi:hypothetical protein
MALEFPNTLEAAGLFQPVVPDPPILGPDNIVSAQGFQAFDPAATTLVPKGGFTRTAAGEYLLGLLDGMDPLEGAALIQPVVGAPTVIPTSFIVPRVAPFANPTDGKTVGVHMKDLDDAAADQNFYAFVFRFATGPHLLP